MGYPKKAIQDYAERKITRAQFIRQFLDWQKANGIDYNCKGTAHHGLVGVTYRGVGAVIKNGVLDWVCGGCRDPKKSDRRFVRDTAQSVFEFCRKVDFAKNGGAAWI